jgi:hypothetical protein
MNPLLKLAIDALAPFAPDGGVDAREIDAVERALGVTFPPDVRPIAAAFRGGAIGEKLRHFSWSPSEPLSVVERTDHFRAQGLPGDAVALAVAGRVLHVMVFHTAYPMIHSYVLASAEDPTQLEQPLRQQDCVYFFSYHGFLLDRIETLRYVPVRAAVRKRFPKLTPGAARKWRHRWAPHEIARITEILKRGVRAADRLATHVVDGKEYADLRGFVMSGNRTLMLAEEAGKGPLLERVDFSFADVSFFGVDARDCLFRGAQMSATQSRFHGCDFTMVDGARAMLPGFGREFLDCDFTGATLVGCHMGGRFERCDFTAADLWSAPMRGSDARAIRDCVLTDARVRGDFGPWRSLKYGFPLDPSDAMS